MVVNIPFKQIGYQRQETKVPKLILPVYCHAKHQRIKNAFELASNKVENDVSSH
jgi:hypothetical protein